MSAGEGTAADGLVVNFLASGGAVVAEGTVASDDGLRENVVKNVDIFFFSTDNKGEVARYYHREVGEMVRFFWKRETGSPSSRQKVMTFM